MGPELLELCARELRRAGLPESVCSRPPFLPAVVQQVYGGDMFEKRVVQRQPGALPIEFNGRLIAGASVPSKHGGVFTLNVYETDAGHFVVEFIKAHPTKAPRRGTFAWLYPHLEDAIKGLVPGALTDLVLEQLTVFAEPT